MWNKGRRVCAKRTAAFALLLAFCAMNLRCAKTVPIGVAAGEPKIPDRVLHVSATFREAPTRDFHYYFAFETTAEPNSLGPRDELCCEDAGKNWDYYVLFDSPAENIQTMTFSESIIKAPNDIFDLPTPLQNSNRYVPDPKVAGNKIEFQIVLSNLISRTATGTLSLNIITSRSRISEDQDVPAIDSLEAPFIQFENDATVNIQKNQTNIGDNDVAETFNYPGDILDWSVLITE